MTNPTYTQKEYERDIAIRDGAPEGATHYPPKFREYYRETDTEDWIFDEGEWHELHDGVYLNIRSLSDIHHLIAFYEREQANKLVHVGYTNGHQIEYAKEDEGAFYPNTENNCWIPLYMLDVHSHRLEYSNPQERTDEQ